MLDRGRRCLTNKAGEASDLNNMCDNSIAEEVHTMGELCVEVESGCGGGVRRGCDGE